MPINKNRRSTVKMYAVNYCSTLPTIPILAYSYRIDYEQ